MCKRSGETRGGGAFGKRRLRSSIGFRKVPNQSPPVSIPSLDPASTAAPLAPNQITESIQALVDEAIPAEPKAAFLTALSRRGETPEEIAGFASGLRELATPVPLGADFRSGREILDVCGTGGDRLNTFNISTTVALVCAAAGVVVAKHGNRAITSGSGSADVLEALGVRVDLTPAAAAEALQRHGFVFLFAPRYHPAFRNIAPARKLCADQGQRTIFNILGPLLNPARPTAQLVGVPRPGFCDPMARALQTLGIRRAFVVSGSVPPLPGSGGETRWMDEISTLGPNTVAEFLHPGGLSVSEWNIADFPLQPATLADLAGGDCHVNAAIIRGVLAATDRSPRRDAVQLGSAAALFIANRTRSIQEGWDLAGELLDSGAAARKLANLQGA